MHKALTLRGMYPRKVRTCVQYNLCIFFLCCLFRDLVRTLRVLNVMRMRTFFRLSFTPVRTYLKACTCCIFDARAQMTLRAKESPCKVVPLCKCDPDFVAVIMYLS